MKRAIGLALLGLGLLLRAGLAPAADPAPAAVGDIAFYYGVVPAEVVLKHAQAHAERQMHGGAPAGSSHVVVALFDATKGERIGVAAVTATVTLVGGASQTKRLEPMDIAGLPSFGNFFHMADAGVYRLRFEARRPRDAHPASAEFEYRVSAKGRR